MGTDISLYAARQHLTKGLEQLAHVEEMAGEIAAAAGIPTLFGHANVMAVHVASAVAVANAHLSAAMAITNILLTDPAEMPEPIER